MTDKRKPGSFLLPLIAKIRAERVGDNVEQLSTRNYCGPWLKV